MKKIFSYRLFKLLFTFFLFYSFVRFLKNIILKFNGVSHQDSSWGTLFFDNIITENIFNGMLILFIIYVTKVLISRSYNWYFIFFTHVFLSILTVILIFIIYDFYLFYAKNLTFDRTFRYYLLNITDYSNNHFLIYFINVFIIYTYYYVNKTNDIELEKANLQRQLSDVKVNILKYQLHPHFFFNTLNSISQLIEVDKKLAQNTLADFSDLLRDIVYLKDTNFLNLGKEIDILSKYLAIMSIRFSDDLKINIDVQEGLDDILIPSLMIQPILENSFKHGYSYENTSLKIDISIKKNNENLEIIIKNNGERLPEKVSYGTGLKNTDERLKSLYNENYKFSIENNLDNTGVITEIIFPVKYEDHQK
jgi:sensor histidine kinase YesM